MSLFLAGRRLAEVEAAKRTAKEPPGPTTAGIRGRRQQDEDEEDLRPQPSAAAPAAFLAAIAARIPAETIGAYLTALPFVRMLQGELPQVLLAIALLVLTPVIEYLGFVERKRQSRPAYQGLKSVPWLDLGISMIAFIVWLGALPSSVFAAFSWYTPALGAVVLVITSLALTQVDRARRIRWI